MPLQSGSTKILKDMKRGYTKEWFLNRALKLRKLCPEVCISTDIIVAYPGESDGDFEDTMNVINQVKFEQIFSFKFSPRPLTPAANLIPIEDNIASMRLKMLQDRHTQILDEIMLKQNGKKFEVYFEELRENNQVAGRTFSNFSVLVKGSEELLGKILEVEIIEPKRMVLYGKVIS